MSIYKNEDTDQIARALYDYYEESRREFYVIPREVLNKWHNHLKVLDEKAEAYDEIEKIYLDENTNRMEKYFGVVGILNEESEWDE